MSEGINSAELGAAHAVRCAEADWSAIEDFELINIQHKSRLGVSLYMAIVLSL